MNRFGAAVAACMALAAADFLSLLLTNDRYLSSRPLFIAMSAAYCFGSAFYIALPIAIWDVCWRRLRRPVAAGLVTFAALVVLTTFGENIPEKLTRYPQFFLKCAIGIPLFAAWAAIAYADTLPRAEGRRNWIPKGLPQVLFVLAGLAVAMVPDYRWRPEEYYFIHLLLKTAGVALLFFVLTRATEVFKLRRFLIAVLVAGAVSAIALTAWPDASQAVKAGAHGRTRHVSHFLTLIQSALDWDRDGYSAWLGGGDPNDSDPKVYLSHSEVPANGIDDNGIAGDLPAQRRPSAPPVPALAAGEQPNIVLILLCTFRADHLSLYGYERPTTPNLEAYAKNATLFENAYTPYPMTPDATGSLLTGRYPTRFLFHDSRGGEGDETLHKILKRSGYQTAAILPTGWFKRELFYGAGFDVFDNTAATEREHNQKRAVTAERVSDNALAYLEKAQKPFFLFLSYFDPHEEYVQQPEFGFGETTLDLYDSEIAYADRHIGRVLSYLETQPVGKNTIVAIVGDHGEEFGDHGGVFHGRKIYQELVRVLWIIRAPGLEPRRIDKNVSTSRLAPTLLELAGLPAQATMDTSSVVPMMKGQSAPEEPVYLAGHYRRGLVEGRYKMILDLKHNFFELYDLEKDPGESRNIYDEPLPGKDQLKRLLFERIDAYSYGQKD